MYVCVCVRVHLLAACWLLKFQIVLQIYHQQKLSAEVIYSFYCSALQHVEQQIQMFNHNIWNAGLFELL